MLACVRSTYAGTVCGQHLLYSLRCMRAAVLPPVEQRRHDELCGLAEILYTIDERAPVRAVLHRQSLAYTQTADLIRKRHRAVT